MEFATRMLVKAQGLQAKARDLQKGLSKGQTMAEYALILAAVAVVVFIAYQTMGGDIDSLLSKVDSQL